MIFRFTKTPLISSWGLQPAQKRCSWWVITFSTSEIFEIGVYFWIFVFIDHHLQHVVETRFVWHISRYSLALLKT